jgi:hypothetical protein
MFLGKVVSFCKTIYLNLPEATRAVGVLLIAAVGMIHLVETTRAHGRSSSTRSRSLWSGTTTSTGSATLKVRGSCISATQGVGYGQLPDVGLDHGTLAAQADPGPEVPAC